MSDIKPTTNAQLPDRLYGEHYPDSFLNVSESVRNPSVATLGDYIRHLQEVNEQPDQPNVANQPIESGFQHICPNNPILTCNCTDPKYCAELGSDPDHQHGNIPNTNHDGFSDNIDYTGIPTAKGKSKISGWTCVVVGFIRKAWATASKRVFRTTASKRNTKQRIDARLNNDGLAATTKL
jgi:hypothetical protein